MEVKFYICEKCGNLIEMIRPSGVRIVCCGQEMTELVPNTVEAATEKHIPVCRFEENKVFVKVGEAEHPMVPEHYIQWIYLKTKQGIQRKELHPGEKPEACFTLCEGDEALEVYEYCNVHGLWMA